MKRSARWMCVGMAVAALCGGASGLWAYEPVLGPPRPFQKINLGTLKFPDKHPLIFYTPEEIEQVKALIRSGDESLPQVRRYREIVANAEAWVGWNIEVDPKGSEYRAMLGGLCAKDSTQLEHRRLRDRSWVHRCPQCSTLYEGEAYDSWARGMENMHLAWQVQNFGLAYALGGDARYARRAREILLGFARTYTGMKTPCTEEYLNLFYWNEYMCTGYDLIYESRALSDQDRRLIDDGLFRPLANSLMQRAQSERGNNRVAHAIANAAMVGFLLRDRDIVDFCLNSPEDVTAPPLGTYPCSFAYLMENCVDQEGLWIERIGYHWYTMQGLVNLTEPAYRAGINLYAHPRFHAMFTGPVQLLFPDGGIGERSGSLPILRYEMAQLRAPDPLFEKVLAGTDAHNLAVNDRTLWIRPTWPTGGGPAVFDLPSRNFTGWGYTILRSGQAPAQTYLSMAWLDHAVYGGHAEEMKFGVIYHAGGRLWTPFANAPYTDPLCGAWSRRPVNHNALTVDGQAQKISFGGTVAFQAGPRLQLVEAVEDQAYPGVTQKRMMMLADGYAIDVCRAASDTEHQYDLAHKYHGDMTSVVDFQKRPSPLGWRAGYEYLDDLRSVRTSKGWSADWRQDADHALRLTMLGGPATEVIAGTGPSGARDQYSVIMARRWGKQTAFVSLMEAYGSRPMVSSAELMSPSGEDGTAVKVTRTGATDYLLVNPGSGMRRYQDLQLDGEFGLVSVPDGSPTAHYAQLVNGRQLGGGGWEIRSSLPATLYVEQADNGEYLVSSGSDTSGMVIVRGRSAANAKVTGDGADAITATSTADSVQFALAAGRTCRIAGLSGLTQVALEAAPKPASESRPAAVAGTQAALPAPIQGKNRVRNSGLEVSGPASADPWLFGSTYYEQNFRGEHAYDDTVAHSGKYSLRLPGLNWFNPVTRETWLLQGNVVASPGASPWTLSAYLRADKPTKVRLCLYGQEASWGENDEGGVSQVYEIGTEWQRVSFTRQFSAGISTVGIVIKREHQAFGGQVWVDDVQLENGPAATAYSPDAWTREAQQPSR